MSAVALVGRGVKRRLVGIVAGLVLALAGTGLATPALAAEVWTGTISSFTASRPVVDSNDASSTVEVRLTESVLGTDQRISIYSGTTLSGACGARAATGCKLLTSIPFGESRTFTAFVSTDTPLDAFPAVVAASAAVTVTHAGWPGGIASFIADRTILDADHPSADVSVTLTDPIFLRTPYTISFYDHRGSLVKHCTRASTACRLTSVPGAGTARIYRAYVALDAPEHGPPSGIVASAGPVVVSAIPEGQLLDSDFVQSLVASVGAKYSAAEGCLRLGESTRVHALGSTVPDATLVCNASGMQKALQLIMNTAGAMGAISALQTLADTDSGPEPSSYNPECDHVAADGTCLDQGSPDAGPTPEPEPGGGTIGGGGGIPPRDSCLDEESRTLLREAMPEQYHHMATQYGTWGQTFQRILDRYRLSVSDSARDWNVHAMPHRGPHPAEYHQWVLENMRAADAAANGDVDTFLALFDQWVTQKVLDDPTIVRLAYWKC